MNAHLQADEPPLSFVMEFNAAESEMREAQARLKKMAERIQRLPRTQQRFVMQVIDTLLARQHR